MTRERDYPDAQAGPFRAPPIDFTDGVGRSIAIRAIGEGPVDDEQGALVGMYDTFDPADRAQGIPPTRTAAIRDWVAGLLGTEAVNVAAWHDERAVGHATLVPDGDGAYELAIFVHQDYQRAGIGRQLIEALLGAGAERGVERVWLTVERWNAAAEQLYRDVGFETTRAENFEIEMALRMR